MFSYGTLTPATFQTVGSTPPGPSYNYIWAATSSSDPYKSILVSTDGLNWAKKTGSSVSNQSYYYLEFINETKEIVKFGGISGSGSTLAQRVICYNILSDTITSTNSSYMPFGTRNSNPNNPLAWGDRVTFNNGRNMWLAVTSTNNATYGGVTAYNTGKYLNGSKSANQKLRYQIADYYIVNSDSTDVIIHPSYGDTGYLYYQASGNFVSGSFTNVWSNYNTTLTNAGITSYKGVYSCHYMPNVGFVFISKYGPVVFDITNNTWSAQRIWSLGSGYGINLEMMTYEPERGRLYFIGDDDSNSSGFIKIYYTDDGVNWNTLGNLVSGNINPNGKKSIAADYDKVIVCSNSGQYAIYTYSTGAWTFNTGITFPSGDSFYGNGYIYCFPYLNS